jgi:hypothetical protein
MYLELSVASPIEIQFTPSVSSVTNASNRLVYLAFLSKPDKEDKRDNGDGYRIAIFDEESFLAFLKAWIDWPQRFPPDRRVKFAVAAE